MVRGVMYGAGEFLAVHEYRNVIRWADVIAERPAVKRGQTVNRAWGGAPATHLPERHDASDIDRVLAAQ